MSLEVSQGRFNVRRDLSGRIRIECPPVMLIPRDVAIHMARAILQMAGAELIVTEPGGLTVTARKNGNGGAVK